MNASMVRGADDDRYVVGVDIGGTFVRTVVDTLDPATAVETESNVGPSVVASTPASLDELIGIVDEAVANAPGAVDAVGIAVPGLVEGTVARWVPNIAYLDDVDLADMIGPRVVVANDAHLSALSEAVDGAARDVDDALVVALGTGIGSAVLADGRIVRGQHGGACSIGWAWLDDRDTVDTPSVSRGWLERQAGGKALEESAERLHLDSVGALFAAARAGDPAAREVVDRASSALGGVLATIVATLDSARIVLVGGVTQEFDLLAVGIRSRLAASLPPHLQEVEVVCGVHGSRAGIRGAVHAARAGVDWWKVRE